MAAKSKKKTKIAKKSKAKKKRAIARTSAARKGSARKGVRKSASTGAAKRPARSSSSPTPSAEVVVSKPTNSPFNAIGLVVATASDNNAIEFGSSSLVHDAKGDLVAITAAHVILNPKLNINGIMNPKLLGVFPGTYAVNGSALVSTSDRLQPVSCTVHDKFAANPNATNSVSYDIAIIRFAKGASIKGAPMTWADATDVLPGEKTFSVTGHKASSGNLSILCKMRHAKVTYFNKPVPNLFTYRAAGTSVGVGFSGGPIMTMWSSTPSQVKSGTAYGHHVKASAKPKRAGSSPIEPPWFGGIKYSGEILTWMRKNGL
jgi:hypothetical protein